MPDKFATHWSNSAVSLVPNRKRWLEDSEIVTNSSDILVIGGGLIGCAAAWNLANSGASVTLVEAGEINAGASGRNAGSLHFQLERRFLEHGDALAEQAAQVVTLSRLAVDDWRDLAQRLGPDLHIAMHGGLMVAETPAEVALLETKAAREHAHGLDTRMIDGDAARAIVPWLSSGVLAACHAPDEGHADPRAVTPALARAAGAAGADVQTHVRVTRISARRGGFDVTLESAHGTQAHACEKVLIAAGAFTPQLAALANIHVPLFPVGLQMNVTERTALFLPQLIQHAGRRLSMKQTHSGNLLIGGGWPSHMAVSAGSFDPAQRPLIDKESLIANLRVAADVIPRVADLNLIRSWTAVTTISADQLPIAGEVPQQRGLFVAAGGSAFTLGLTLARLVAGAMLGKADDRLAVVSPRRFGHLNSFMGQQ